MGECVCGDDLVRGSVDEPWMSLSVCGHGFHLSCVAAQARATIERGSCLVAGAPCPRHDCGSCITHDDLVRVVHAGQLEYADFMRLRRLQEAALMAALQKDGRRMVDCPTPDCGTSFELHGGILATCPTCGHSWCVECGGAAHAAGVLCPRIAGAINDGEDVPAAAGAGRGGLPAPSAPPPPPATRLDKERAADEAMARWRAEHPGSVMQCPRCRNGVEKRSGCNHISCRCGHEWCFRCGSDWESGRCVRRGCAM